MHNLTLWKMARFLGVAPILLLMLAMTGCMDDADPPVGSNYQQILTSWGPEIRAYYGLTGTDGSSSTTIAIVGGGNLTGVETLLATYLSAKSLPACSSMSGCITYIKGDTGVAGHQSTTVSGEVDFAARIAQMAKLGCPACKLALIETLPVSGVITPAGVQTAVKTAKNKGAIVINPYLPWLDTDTTVLADIDNAFQDSGTLLVMPVGNGSGSYRGLPGTAVGVAPTSLTAHIGQTRPVDEDLDGGTGAISTHVARQGWEPTNLSANFHSATMTVAPGIGAAVYTSNGWETTSGSDVAASVFGGFVAASGLAFAPADIAAAPAFFTLHGGTDDNSNPIGTGTYTLGRGYGPVDFGAWLAQ